jgi:hypothetical protein
VIVAWWLYAMGWRMHWRDITLSSRPDAYWQAWTMTLDDLAHLAETEAEVLRAVAHMTPSRAQVFLMELALKIRRAELPSPRRGMGAGRGGVQVTLPVLLASTIRAVETEPSLPLHPAPRDGTQSARILDFVRASGSASMRDIRDAIGGKNLHERNRAGSLTTYLKSRGKLVLEDGQFSVVETNGAATAGAPLGANGMRGPLDWIALIV